jgi:hypothetical protein
MCPLPAAASLRAARSESARSEFQGRCGAGRHCGGALASGDEGTLLTLDARQTGRDSGTATFDVMALARAGKLHLGAQDEMPAAAEHGTATGLEDVGMPEGDTAVVGDQWGHWALLLYLRGHGDAGESGFDLLQK